MRRLLIILYNDFPWYHGLSDRLMGLIKELIKQGLTIKVLARLLYGYRDIDGMELEIKHIRLGRIKNRFVIRRLVSLVSWTYYQIRCFLEVIREAKNIGVVQFEHYDVFPVAYAVRVLLRKAIIADDINLLSIRPLSPLRRAIFSIIEKLILKRSTLVITASPITYAIAKKRYRNVRILYLPNAVKPVAKKNLPRERWIVFLGNLAFEQNVKAAKTVFRIVEKLFNIRKDFKVLIIGSPIEKLGNLKHHALVRKGVIRLLEAVPEKSLENILSKVMIALLPFFNLPRWGGQMTKTLRLMSHGLCVVASAEAVKWIRGARPYIHYVPINNVDDSINTLNMLLSNIDMCIRTGFNARNLILTSYTWEHVSKDYTRIIKKLISM